MSELTLTTAPSVPGHRVHGVIGQGATSVVWAASDAVGRPVAIKVPRELPDPVATAQGEHERRVLAAVRHDHLVPLRDVVALADGRPALVFDQVTGTTLRAMVRIRGHLRPGEAVTVLTPVCEAVAELHAAGATHGDLSAGNIMVTADGRPMVLDLGAARIAGAAAAVHGTPGFVAPEVRAGAIPGEAADVFALGAIAWFCLTGNGAPETDIRLDLDTVHSHVGPELGDVVAACIDPDPAARPSAAALAARFYDAVPAEPVEVVVGGDEASALTHRLRAQAADPGAVTPAPGSRRLGERLRRLGRAVPAAGFLRARVLLVAGVTVVGVGVTWLVLTGLGGGGAPAAPAPRVPQAGTQATPEAGSTTTPGGSSRATDAGSARVLVDPRAPRTRTVELVQALSAARAKALVARDPALLGVVHEPAAPSWRTDADVIATLTKARNRYVGLELEVAEATFVSGTSTTATVRARVDWTGYEVVNDSGARATQPAARGELLDFTLVRGAAGWRIRSVSDPPAT